MRWMTKIFVLGSHVLFLWNSPNATLVNRKDVLDNLLCVVSEFVKHLQLCNKHLVWRVFIHNECLNLVTLISFFQLQYLVKQIQQQLIFVEPFPVFKLGKFDLLDSKLSKHYSRTGLIYRDNHIGIIAFKFSFSINFYNIFLKKQSSGISFAINDFNMVFP